MCIEGGRESAEREGVMGGREIRGGRGGGGDQKEGGSHGREFRGGREGVCIEGGRESAQREGGSHGRGSGQREGGSQSRESAQREGGSGHGQRGGRESAQKAWTKRETEVWGGGLWAKILGPKLVPGPELPRSIYEGESSFQSPWLKSFQAAFSLQGVWALGRE